MYKTNEKSFDMRKYIPLFLLIFFYTVSPSISQLYAQAKVQCLSLGNTHLSYIPNSNDDNGIFYNCYHQINPNQFMDFCSATSNISQAFERNSYDYLWINGNGWTISHLPIIKTSDAPLNENKVFFIPIYNGPPPPSSISQEANMTTPSLTNICGVSPSDLGNILPTNTWQRHLEVESDDFLAAMPFIPTISTLDSTKVIIVTANSELEHFNFTINTSIYNSSSGVVEAPPLFTYYKVYGFNQDNDIEVISEANITSFNFSKDISLKKIKQGSLETYFIELFVDMSVSQALDFTDSNATTTTTINLATGQNANCNISTPQTSQCEVKSLSFELVGPRDPNRLSLWINNCEHGNRKKVHGILTYTNDGDYQVNQSIVASIPISSSIDFPEDFQGFSYQAETDGLSFDQFNGSDTHLTWKFTRQNGDQGFYPASHDFQPEGRIKFSFYIDNNMLGNFTSADWHGRIKFDNQPFMNTTKVKIKKMKCVEIKTSNTECCECTKSLWLRIKNWFCGNKRKTNTSS